MNTMDLEAQINEWKKKCENAEKNLATLKKLAHKAVYDYEDLLRKYDQNQKQYEEIKERLEERESQLKKLQTMLEPVYDEYSQLETKYEIEKGCRTKAEEYATKVNQANKKLKRQSQYLLDKMNTNDLSITDINFEELDEATDTGSSGENQIEHLQSIIEDLQNDMAKLKHRVQVAEEEKDIAIEKERETKQKYEQEAEVLKRTRSNLEHNETQLHNFKRVSVRAYEEYSILQEKLEKEKVLHSEAEKYASQMLSERNTMKRQSAVLINNAMSDAQLADALLKIEELTKELNEQKEHVKSKVQELEDSVDAHKQEQSVTELENNIQVEEIDDLKKQLKEASELFKKVDKENEELRKKLDVAEERLRPPVAPPPPPILTGGLTNPLKQLLKKRPKAGEEVKKAVKNQDPKYSQAIDEMMQRIKSGTALRPTQKRRQGIGYNTWSSGKPSLPDTGDSAMEELHAILSKEKKRSHSSGDLRETMFIAPPGSESDNMMGSSEFQAMFDKIQGQRKINPALGRDLSTIDEEKDIVSPKSSTDQDDGGVTRM